MTDEKALVVVIGIDKPAGDPISVVAADLAGVGVEYVDSVYFDLDLTIVRIKDFNVRFAKDDEKVALAGVFVVIDPMVGDVRVV